MVAPETPLGKTMTKMLHVARPDRKGHGDTGTKVSLGRNSGVIAARLD